MIEAVRENIAIRDGDVSALVWDGPGPLIHFAHANGFNAGTYRGLLAPLSGTFRIVASDARGQGFSKLSRHAGMARGWRVFRDDLIDLLDAIAPDGAILAGHSMGATASLMAAALRPDKVRALVLVEPVLVPRAAWLRFQLERFLPFVKREPSLADRALKRRAEFPSPDMAFAAYRRRGAFKTWPEETIWDYLRGGLVETERGVRLACAPEWEAACFRGAPLGAAALAERVRCPVTLLHAEDGTAGLGEVRRFRRGCPTARIVAVKGATHFLPMEFPQIVREEIERIAGPGIGAG